MRAFVAEYGTGVGRPIGEITGPEDSAGILEWTRQFDDALGRPEPALARAYLGLNPDLIFGRDSGS